MLTSNNLKTLRFVTNLAWHTGIIPFQFKQQKNGDHLIIKSSGKIRVFFASSFCCSTMYLFYIAIRVCQTLLYGKVELPYLMKMGYIFVAYTLPVVLQINTMKTWDESPRFIMEYIKYFNILQAKYLLPNEKGSKCMKFFCSVLLIGIAVNIQNLVLILKKPHQEQFVTSILENPKDSPVLFRLPLLIWNMLVWTNCWANVWVFCFHTYLYFTCGIFLLKELDISVKQPRTHRRLREPRVIVGTLRSFQMLHRLWQTTFQDWFCPSHKATAVALATVSTYGFIKMSGPRSVIIGFVALLTLMYLSTLFYKFGKFSEMSKRTLQNWHNSPNCSKWMKKFLKSVPVFSVGIGSFYNVKKKQL